MKILFWDIDGTLIRTAKAGLYAFAQATTELWGRALEFDTLATAGMTDNFIARQIIEVSSGREASLSEIDCLCRRYEELLPRELVARKGLILPEVANILACLHERDDYKLLLLTGNSKMGAQIKLKYFALDRYFDFASSAFAEQFERRSDIANNALKIVQANWGDPGQHKIYVIGDTPHDIECGRGIGAYTIGVATGSYSLTELQSLGPWWSIEVLPEAEIFATKLATSV
ncbi:Pyrophosphatase PpaX [Sporomusa ovata DSM 2662]|uniref:Hydrolase, haloacid dehalogenase-like family n=1 Tax=Sporomusa ovata TaxID=2378 RepID=A0A0U1KTT6_9FIRM|nr:HAD hydrolase-like protein [Sporomusa ovata]EQB26748.1 putative phosphatase [Sporomusa ovata DSM 2662]CQR70842.1 Hydrolase, haloacid dehalogenase-like family [Sporomusa ovata]